MKKFTRTVEDFTCENCGATVLGNGYTNHCPKCLWSKHVDKTPGDRASKCGGMMRPVSVTIEQGNYVITHKCELCGYTRRQHASPADDTDTIISLSVNNDFIFGK